MSTTPKLNPKSIAIKKKFYCRLGLPKKRYLPSVDVFADAGNQNTKWSVPISPFMPPNSGRNVGRDIFFIEIEERIRQLSGHRKENYSTTKLGDLVQWPRNKNHRFHSEALLYIRFLFLRIALSLVPIRIDEYYDEYYDVFKYVRSSSIWTVSKHVKLLQESHTYLAGLPPAESTEEDDL